MALPSFRGMLAGARQIDELLDLNRKVRESLEAVDHRLRAIEDRLMRLEAAQGQLVTEARSAAAASTMVASNILSDVVTRITRLEERAPRPKQPRLVAPRKK
jgi:hypothetical protein